LADADPRPDASSGSSDHSSGLMYIRAHREPTHRILAQAVSHLLFIRVNEKVACGVHVVQGIVQEWQHREEWVGSRARSAVELVPWRAAPCRAARTPARRL